MNRIPSLQELCLDQLDALYVEPRRSKRSAWDWMYYRRLNPLTTKKGQDIQELIENACFSVLQKMYSKESGLGEAVFSRKGAQQFFELRKRTNDVFCGMRLIKISEGGIHPLISLLFQQKFHGSIQEKMRLIVKCILLGCCANKPFLEELFNQLFAREGKNFWDFLFSYILNQGKRFVCPIEYGITFENDLLTRYQFATHCVRLAGENGDYEALELGVSTMKKLYEQRGEESDGWEPIPFILGDLVKEVLFWGQDLAVAVRLIQLGADLTRAVYSLSSSQAKILGKPKLAGKPCNLYQLISYLYPDEPEAPILSFTKQEFARQQDLIVPSSPPHKRRRI